MSANDNNTGDFTKVSISVRNFTMVTVMYVDEGEVKIAGCFTEGRAEEAYEAVNILTALGFDADMCTSILVVPQVK